MHTIHCFIYISVCVCALARASDARTTYAEQLLQPSRRTDWLQRAELDKQHNVSEQSSTSPSNPTRRPQALTFIE